MFEKTLTSMTTAQKAALRDAGVTDQMRSDWLHDRRNPTETELLLLEHVSGVPVRELLIEVAARRFKPKNRALLARAVGRPLPQPGARKGSFASRVKRVLAAVAIRARRRTAAGR